MEVKGEHGGEGHPKMGLWQMLEFREVLEFKGFATY